MSASQTKEQHPTWVYFSRLHFYDWNGLVKVPVLLLTECGIKARSDKQSLTVL